MAELVQLWILQKLGPCMLRLHDPLHTFESGITFWILDCGSHIPQLVRFRKSHKNNEASSLWIFQK
jgi:hypothetical protein